MRPVNKNPSPRELESFGAVIWIGFSTLACLLLWRGKITPACVLACIGFVVGLLAIVVPRASRPFYIIWMSLGLAIGKVVSPLVMTVIYFAVVTPLGLVLRCVGKDALLRKKKAPGETYWVAHKTGMPADYYKRLF